MLWPRPLVAFPIGGLAVALACASHSRGGGAPDSCDSACDGGLDGAVESGDDTSDCAAAATAAAVQSADGSAPGQNVASFLGTWTLVGTAQWVCAAATSNSIPESLTMTLRPEVSPDGVPSDAEDSIEAGGATDSSGVSAGTSGGYLAFDAGLGCLLTLSVASGAARLVPAPQRCGVEGKPIDRVFTSVEIAPAPQFAGWLRLEETYTDQSGCTFLVQGFLLP